MMTSAANTNASPVKSPIVVWEIRGKDRRYCGRVIPGDVMKGHHASIVPGKSIRLFGLIAAGARLVKRDGRFVPCEEYVYRRDFKVGDVAAIRSYNLTYTGVITAITVKSVTIVEYKGTSNERTYRLDLETFASRNWDFDAEETAKRNADWRD